MQTAGFVLAGGTSSRMGRDKALLPIEGDALVEVIAREVAGVTGSVAIVGAPARYSSLMIECLPDERPGFGPLSGIETALASGRGDLNLIVACDMPNIDTGVLCALLQKGRESTALCVAVRDLEDRVHPLCAVYRRECLPFVRAAIDTGRLKLHRLLSDMNAATISIGRKMWNLNTPDEWAEWNGMANSAVWQRSGG